MRSVHVDRPAPMAEDSQKPESAAPGRSGFEIGVRIALTLAVGVFVWNCVRMFNLVRITSAVEPYVATSDRQFMDTPWTPQERQRRIRADFPLPLYPGAKDEEFGQLHMNENPFFRCDYEVAATTEDVLRFYRQRLGRGGWRDTTDDLLAQSSLSQDTPSRPGVLDLQDETFLRYYDHVKRTQATFTRRGAFATIVVDQGSRPYLTRVGIRHMEGGGPEEFARELAGIMDPSENGSERPLIFSQQFGARESLQTRILTSRKSAKTMRDQMSASYVDKGWTRVEMPPEAEPKDGFGACLIRGQEMVILHANRDPESRGSKVIVTVLGPGKTASRR